MLAFILMTDFFDLWYILLNLDDLDLDLELDLVVPQTLDLYQHVSVIKELVYF